MNRFVDYHGSDLVLSGDVSKHSVTIPLVHLESHACLLEMFVYGTILNVRFTE